MGDAKQKLDAVSAPDSAADDSAAPPSSAEKKKPHPSPKGRRVLASEDLPEERIELLDPELEGEAERIGFEESYRLGFRRASAVRIVVAHATYKKKDGEFVTVDVPKEV